MCMDVRNTLERLCVQLNMADINMSAGESSCNEKHDKRKRKGKWNEENVTAFIRLLEERPCLWNIFDSQYTKREKRDSAYKEIAETLEREVGEIKTKINNLRAQLGREIGKISDILFEAEMGSMSSSIPNNYNHPIYDQPIPKLPLNLTIGGAW